MTLVSVLVQALSQYAKNVKGMEVTDPTRNDFEYKVTSTAHLEPVSSTLTVIDQVARPGSLSCHLVIQWGINDLSGSTKAR